MSDMRFSTGSASDGTHVLPGEDLIEKGIRDLRDRRETIEAFAGRDRSTASAARWNRYSGGPIIPKLGRELVVGYARFHQE